MSSQVTVNSQANTTKSDAKSTAPSLVQNVLVFAFGGAILFAVGFMPMEAAHNAAHDTRHALAFPCH